MKVTIDQLQSQRPRIHELRLKSFECEHYLVQVTTDQGESLVYAENGKPALFRSQLAAKIPFKGLEVARATLEHQSTYNEMIGLDVGSVEPLVVDISLPDADLS
ncbi:MAG: hypothetical protein RL143_895 [Pseudomonadota bacterium]|jgi:hypothetical protein